jgi:isopentenyl-diphosphate delta-isomerase
MIHEEIMTLVNEQDQEIGFAPKMETHRKNLLHRAFSVMIYNQNHELLIQQRASTKYHSQNLWANSCCGHPRPQESVQHAAERRLKEELGFTVPLTYVCELKYQVDLEQGLHEHEYVHIFKGSYDDEISPNQDEVQAVRYIGLKELQDDVKNSPSKYAGWFSIYVKDYFDRVF